VKGKPEMSQQEQQGRFFADACDSSKRSRQALHVSTEARERGPARAVLHAAVFERRLGGPMWPSSSEQHNNAFKALAAGWRAQLQCDRGRPAARRV